MSDASSSSMGELVIRAAHEADAETIVCLIEELAEFEKLSQEVKVSSDDIRRDGFGSQRRFECVLAELSGSAVGFALFFPNYSTFEGRAGLYLEDLFVRPGARGHGVGRALIAHLAGVAVERGFPRLDLAVLHWNPAKQFYRNLGFVPLEEWQVQRLQGEALATLGESGHHSD